MHPSLPGLCSGCQVLSLCWSPLGLELPILAMHRDLCPYSAASAVTKKVGLQNWPKSKVGIILITQLSHLSFGLCISLISGHPMGGKTQVSSSENRMGGDMGHSSEFDSMAIKFLYLDPDLSMKIFPP